MSWGVVPRQVRAHHERGSRAQLERRAAVEDDGFVDEAADGFVTLARPRAWERHFLIK